MGRLNFIVILAVSSSIVSEQSLSLQAQKREWWERTVIYQIYPRSYLDTNGDGIGDLNGIHEKLDYIKNIGVQTVWVQPFFESPMADFGYDVSDLRQIDPLFGNMTTFKQLLKGTHDRGMKFVIDLIPNHVSDKHEWFQKSIDKVEPYTDYFIWVDPKGYEEHTNKPIPPNNWLSIFEGTAWEWNDKRQQFYYRIFSKGQPDLNFRNRKVRDAMIDVIRFWLDLGVDGFRIDAVKFIIEEEHLKDEPYITPGIQKFENLKHIYTLDLPENYEILHEWRVFVDEYSKKDNKSRLLCTETYTTITELMKFYGNETYPIANFPLYFGLVSKINSIESTAHDLDEVIHLLMDNLPDGRATPNWQISNHDNPRLGTRINPELIDVGNMLVLLLPGVSVIYYGDEIGMINSPFRKDQIMDPGDAALPGFPKSRDGTRAPMQWDDTNIAGFTNNQTSWLPVNPDYWHNNVKRQSKDPESHLNKFKQLIELRKTPVIQEGGLETCVFNKWVHIFVRRLSNSQPIIMVISNLGSEVETVCARLCFKDLPDEMVIHTSSINSGYETGDKFYVNGHHTKGLCSTLRPKAGVVLTSHADKLSFKFVFFFSIILVKLILARILV